MMVKRIPSEMAKSVGKVQKVAQRFVRSLPVKMPKSSSVTSESSHESESPRKTGPSITDVAMDIDDLSSAMVAATCEHVQALEHSPDMLPRYHKTLKWRSSSLRGPHLKRQKMQPPVCSSCKVPLRRPAVCLQCQFIGCWTRGHVQGHMRDSGHTLGVDLIMGSIYCAVCNAFESAPLSLEAETFLTSTIKEEESLKRHKRHVYQSWQPSAVEKSALSSAHTIPCEVRRGFLNLGATCYMSVILQAFLHNPLLRNFFLSDKHNSQLCGKPNCMCCELDQMFADVFNPLSTSNTDTGGGNGLSVGPLSLLRTTWENNMDMAGYAQHDAHEFFITVLNQLHAGSAGATDGSACTCIVHQVFAGQLQSDVKCGQCGHINPTIDPMLDISLELKGLPNGKPPTLASCLRRFTEMETLPAKAYVCDSCKTSNSEAKKQLSIRKLPPVLCIQLKRFEHKSSAAKIDTPVKFPGIINMSPYTTAAIGMQAREGKVPKLDPATTYDYELFAVVNHEGQLNTGHYTNFARSQNEWYRFDDEKVTHTTLRECLNSVPYMCFYVKRNLDYGTTSNATTTSSATAMAPPLSTPTANLAPVTASAPLEYKPAVAVPAVSNSADADDSDTDSQTSEQ